MTATESQDVLEFLAATAGGCCVPSDIWDAQFDRLCSACATAADAARGTPRAGTLFVAGVDRWRRVEQQSEG